MALLKPSARGGSASIRKENGWGQQVSGGRTARLVDKSGASTNRATGSTFGHWQNALLTNFATGKYTLIASTTSSDDPLAGSPCLGKLTKTVDIVGVPGVIQRLKLESNVLPESPREGSVMKTIKIFDQPCKKGIVQ
jgi:hypothetical protein